MYRDLREYISRLEEEGEVQRIDREVDWSLEAGAIATRSNDLEAPAPFFQKLKGYPQGYRILGEPLGPSSKANRRFIRFSLALGLRPDLTVPELTDEFIRLTKNAPIKPRMVADGPCREEVHLGSDIDLFEFPVPMIHDGDGGRYIGTWHSLVTKDPDTGLENWGMYRAMVHDSRTLGFQYGRPTQHISLQQAKYEAANKPMEFAIALGTEPVSTIVSAMRFPHPPDEASMAGGMRGEPVDLIKCLTVDLSVPATSEIVIEGEMLPHERRDEGPFGEFTGYRAAEKAPRPVGHVKAITHRRNPILPMVCVGAPVDSGDVLLTIHRSATQLDHLRQLGLPVRTVYMPPEAGLIMMVVSSKVPFANYAQHVAAIIWGYSSINRPGYLVVVEDDVDPTDLRQVVWSIATRCHPDRGIYKMTNLPSYELLSYISPEERRTRTGGACTLFDCTWPVHWDKKDIPVKASFDVMFPREMQDKVLNNWTQYGYRGEGI